MSKYEHQLWPEKITTGKKRYSRPACYVFWTTGKTYDRKKRYCHLTDGWKPSVVSKYKHPNYDWKKIWLEKKRYDTVIWSSVVSKYEHQQSTFNLRKFSLGFFILQKQWDRNFLLLYISFLLCMDLQPYSHDCFSKILKTLFDFRNNTYWVSLF